jgi:SAM-dependent methyltransferase
MELKAKHELDGIPVFLSEEEFAAARKDVLALPASEIEKLKKQYDSIPAPASAPRKLSAKEWAKNFYGLKMFNAMNYVSINSVGLALSIRPPFLLNVGRPGSFKASESQVKRHEREAYGGLRGTDEEILSLKQNSVRIVHGKPMSMDDWTYRGIVIGVVAGMLQRENINPSSVLEVGCGFLSNLSLIKKAYPAASLMGLDYNINRLRAGRAIIDGNIPVCCGDALKLPFEDRSFDLAMTVHVMERFGDGESLDKMIREMRRVAKHIVIIEPIYDYQDIFAKAHNRLGKYPSNIVEKLRQAGFEIVGTDSSQFGSVVNTATIILAK